MKTAISCQEEFYAKDGFRRIVVCLKVQVSTCVLLDAKYQSDVLFTFITREVFHSSPLESLSLMDTV